MPDLGLDSVLHRSRDVLYRNLDGEAILVDLRSGTYLGLDGVATFIWERIEGTASLRDILEEVLAAYEVDYETARTDLIRLAGELIEHRLVESNASGGSGPGRPAGR